MNELIVVKQLPIIEENLKKLSKEIDEKVSNAVSLVCTQDTVKDVKELRANLNKEFKELESQRKVVKEQVLKPYNDFEDIYKTYVSEKYKSADSTLKEKIDTVENELKATKEEELISFANDSFVANNIQDYVKYEDIKLNVTLSASVKSLKEQITSFCERIVSDLKLIDSQDFKEEILYEYKKYLDVTIAIVEVKKRHEEMEKAKLSKEEKKEQELTDEIMLEKIENLSAPKVVDNEVYEITFTVRGTKEKLKGVKEFLENGGYEYYEQ